MKFCEQFYQWGHCAVGYFSCSFLFARSVV
jgi:hypothetical protein